MVYDLLKNKELYYGLGEKFKKAFDFLDEASKNGVENGKHIIDGDNVYANVFEYDTVSEGVFEAHKDYIDLQFVLDGHEDLYWKNIKDCKVTKEYDEEGDCLLLDAEDPVVLDLPAGSFVILYPEDVHAPSRVHESVCHVKKIVVKIKVD